MKKNEVNNATELALCMILKDHTTTILFSL